MASNQQGGFSKETYTFGFQWWGLLRWSKVEHQALSGIAALSVGPLVHRCKLVDGHDQKKAAWSTGRQESEEAAPEHIKKALLKGPEQQVPR